MKIRSFWNFAFVLTSLGAVHPAFSQTVNQDEQKQVLRAVIAVAEACEGSSDCFLASARPFGPLHVYVSDDAGRWDSSFAKSVTNFAFGAVSAAATVDPEKMLGKFFCGDKCMFERRESMIKNLPAINNLVKAFAKSKHSVLALWPDGSLLVDGTLVRGEEVRALRKTPALGLIFDRTFAAGTPKNLPISTLESIGILRSMLERSGATAIVRDDTGGIRVIHLDSIAENEAGLIFTNNSPEALMSFGPQSNGAEYRGLSIVGKNIYFYLRS